tara:strand:- start:52 stop:207 length:156 start_codon:yes stop_codon:yes gene_type:complete
MNDCCKDTAIQIKTLIGKMEILNRKTKELYNYLESRGIFDKNIVITKIKEK